MTRSVMVRPAPPVEAPGSVDFDSVAPATFQNVLVGVDGSAAGRDAIALGEQLCAADGRLTLAHVVLVPQPVYGNFHSTGAGKKARAMLERERAAAGVSADVTGMFARSVASGLHRLAADTGADLIVVGSSARGPIARLLRGDDTRGTLSGARCAVAVAPRGYAERPKPIDTIGVAYDGSPDSETAVVAARGLAARHGATLRALTGRDGRLTVGPPRDELLAFGDQVDLLVVGSRGHGPLRRMLLGSTSAALARTARSPLLVLPHRGARQRSRDRPYRARSHHSSARMRGNAHTLARRLAAG